MSRAAADWPVLKRYTKDQLLRIAMPIGGIGTGTISLGGRGDLRDWEIVNQPVKGYVPEKTLFAMHVKSALSRPVTRLLEGPVDPVLFDGSHGCRVPNHGLPRFRDCVFEAAYPLAQVRLSDPQVPVEVRLQAFNPMIPGDAEASGIPAAVLRFNVYNRTGRNVSVSLCGSLQNFIGADGVAGAAKRNVNEYRTGSRRDIRGLFLRSDGVPRTDERWGTMALATLPGGAVSHRVAWPKLSWGDALLEFWDDFSHDGALDQPWPVEEQDAPIGSLVVKLNIPPRQERAVTFLIAWHFPNRMTWTPAKNAPQAECCPGGRCGEDPNRIGNWYATRYTDAWDVANKLARDLPKLEAATVKFVRAFCNSDLPPEVKEAALFNLSTLRSQTCFRSDSGHFFGWEGCGSTRGTDRGGCCHGSCTHVWNYEHATAFLFGGLARTMRDVEFAHATHDDGLMSFRVNLPLERAREWATAAADGQMGCLMKLYREWQLSGDDAMLRRLWPMARKAMEFCWIPGGWDADRDGVMEGCQHNTMDVEYFGPNPEMGTWYLGALRACEEMARHLGDADFAVTCRELFDRGSRWMDEQLFNGEYYEHHIRPIEDEALIAAVLRHRAGAQNLKEPELQLGPGCLADQLVGQLMSDVCGLGDLLKPAHIRQTLRSIMKHNFRRDLRGHFNHLRSFALEDEAGLLVATYPRGGRPKRPFPYCSEVWMGLEYTAAAGLIYAGQTAEGLKIIRAARRRHDGRRRNPFDEPECGHHYARAMASWAAVLAITGFRYSAVEQSMQFIATRRPSTFFWSNGSAWGTCRQRPRRRRVDVELTVNGGAVMLRRFSLSGMGSRDFGRGRQIRPGKRVAFQIEKW